MKNLSKIIISLLVLSLLLSCSEGPNTIFDNIRNDNLIDDSELDNTLSVYSMVRLNSTSRYYIAAGKVRHRLVASDNWSSFKVAKGIHNTIATDGTNLYIGVIHSNGTGDLFRYDPTAAWNPPTNPEPVDLGVTTKYVLKVKNFGANVYASVANDNGTYALRSISGASSLIYSDYSAVVDPIMDFTANGGTLTIVCGNNVYLGDTSNNVTPDSSRTYNGVIFFAGGGDVYYLSTNDGALYQSMNNNPDSSQWTEKTGYEYTKNGTDYPVRFTEFAGAPGADAQLFVGTKGAGFYLIDPVPGTFPVSRFGDTAKNDLYNGAVESFYLDLEDPLVPEVYCCTIGAGLWHNDYTLADDTWGDTWSRD